MEVVIRDIWEECCGHLSAFDIILKLTNNFSNMEYAKNSASFIRIIFMHFHIIALKVKFSMRRKNSHAESIMEESYEGNRNCTSD